MTQIQFFFLFHFFSLMFNTNEKKTPPRFSPEETITTEMRKLKNKLKKE